MKRGTKESRFIIELYLQAKEAGDMSTPFSSKKIATDVGVNRTALHNVVQTLCNINFLKREEDDFVFITPQGISFAEMLLQKQ